MNEFLQHMTGIFLRMELQVALGFYNEIILSAFAAFWFGDQRKFPTFRKHLSGPGNGAGDAFGFKKTREFLLVVANLNGPGVLKVSQEVVPVKILARAI